jgi:hypothetical protein
VLVVPIRLIASVVTEGSGSAHTLAVSSRKRVGRFDVVKPPHNWTAGATTLAVYRLFEDELLHVVAERGEPRAGVFGDPRVVHNPYVRDLIAGPAADINDVAVTVGDHPGLLLDHVVLDEDVIHLTQDPDRRVAHRVQTARRRSG